MEEINYTKEDFLKEIEEKLTKDGHLFFHRNDDNNFVKEFLKEHSIYISLKHLDKIDADMRMLLLLASQHLELTNIVKVSTQADYYISNNYKDDIIQKTISRIFMFDSDKSEHYKQLIVLANEDKHIKDRINFKFMLLDFTDSFLMENGAFKTNSNARRVPLFAVKKRNKLQSLDSHAINYSYNINNVFRTLSRRYKITSDNIRYTNEITDKTKIYPIMDKNIVRSIKYFANKEALYNRNIVIINPNLSYFAEQYNKQIPIEHLLALFDVNKKELKSNLQKVWYLTNPIVCLGLGGLMSNFLYWCERFREYFELNYLFKQLLIFEPDSLEFSNLFRIPLNWKDMKISDNLSDKQLRQFMPGNDNIFSKQTHRKLMLTNSIRNLSPKIRTYNARFNYINLKNCILIGGPDLETRKEIFNMYSDAESDKYFICTTHSNNTFSIDAFPDFDRELTVETYGSIDLNKFLLNMFKMSVELIRILANKEFVDKVKHKFLDYSVDNEDFIANSKKHRCLKNIAYSIN